MFREKHVNSKISKDRWNSFVKTDLYNGSEIMTKRKKITIIVNGAAVLIAAAVVLFIILKNQPAGYRSISITDIIGKVITENDGKTYEAYKNMRLADGYALNTQADSYTRMLLDDDKYVKLEQNSRALFEALGLEKPTKSAPYHTAVPGVFVAGDARRGQSLVVWAIREGLECAREVDRSLMGYTNE